MEDRIYGIYGMYRDGFRSMGLGKLLWKIILIKLIILYSLARIYFPDYLKTNFDTDQERAEHVLTSLSNQQNTIIQEINKGGR